MTALSINLEKPRSMTQIIGAALILALVSQVAIPLPFTPVPLTLQTTMLWVMAAVLGPRKATASVILYIFLGLMGLPVFALLSSGPAIVFGPRGAYLLGYALATFIAGLLFQRFREKRVGLTLLIANASLYFVAIPLLSMVLGFKTACVIGLNPFLVGDLLKILLARSIVKKFFSRKAPSWA